MLRYVPSTSKLLRVVIMKGLLQHPSQLSLVQYERQRKIQRPLEIKNVIVFSVLLNLFKMISHALI